MKESQDCVKVALGDVMKFGRVRFRVKKLFVTLGSNSAQGTKSKHEVSRLNIDSIQPSRLSDLSLGHDTQIFSRRSTETNMDAMVRMHSSANYSFDLQK